MKYLWELEIRVVAGNAGDLDVDLAGQEKSRRARGPQASCQGVLDSLYFAIERIFDGSFSPQVSFECNNTNLVFVRPAAEITALLHRLSLNLLPNDRLQPDCIRAPASIQTVSTFARIVALHERSQSKSSLNLAVWRMHPGF
jgi:hypothetical protein